MGTFLTSIYFDSNYGVPKLWGEFHSSYGESTNREEH